jgi:hypothetical protein
VDDLPDLLLRGPGQGLQGREALVEHRRHQVYPGVGTLGGEAHREEQLIGLVRVKGQGALGGGVELLELLDDGGHSRLVFHVDHLRPIIPHSRALG